MDIIMIPLRYLIDILIWLDVNKTAIFCIQDTPILSMSYKILFCLVGKSLRVVKKAALIYPTKYQFFMSGF
jgi:hypothetical protein